MVVSGTPWRFNMDAQSWWFVKRYLLSKRAILDIHVKFQGYILLMFIPAWGRFHFSQLLFVKKEFRSYHKSFMTAWLGKFDVYTFFFFYFPGYRLCTHTYIYIYIGLGGYKLFEFHGDFVFYCQWDTLGLAIGEFDQTFIARIVFLWSLSMHQPHFRDWSDPMEGDIFRYPTGSLLRSLHLFVFWYLFN